MFSAATTLCMAVAGCTNKPPASNDKPMPELPASDAAASKSSNTNPADVASARKTDERSTTLKIGADPVEPAIVEVETPPKKSYDDSIDVEALLGARLIQEDLTFGWVRLFDGQSLTGWESTSDANWHIEEGELRVDYGSPGFLATKGRFSNFEVQVEFKAPKTTNSGVFLRSAKEPGSLETDCYELNIAPTDDPFPTGSLVQRQRVEPDDIGDLDAEQWHFLHALVDSEHVQTWIDGLPAADYMDASELKSGRVMLQFKKGSVAFRNIRVRPMGYNTLPAETLDSWQASEGEFTHERQDDGSVVLKGGRGDLELLQPLGNFIAQIKVETLAEATNSGMFFRCVPGSPMDGYECQIQNQFTDDRRDPKDFGTGAIFRRVKARAVLSDDKLPTFITVQADGRYIATWVNGVQVVDWADDREPNDNPREGYRAEAGTLQLQAHDPTCEVRFDTMLISPIED